MQETEILPRIPGEGKIFKKKKLLSFSELLEIEKLALDSAIKMQLPSTENTIRAADFYLEWLINNSIGL